MSDDEKKAALLELIDALCDSAFSKNEPEIIEWIQKLNKIYANGYRHNYADLFYKLQEIFSNDSETCEILGENLNVLEQHIKQSLQENKDDLNIKNTAESYKKFADHIRLEIGRYNFIKIRFDRSKTETDSGHAAISIDTKQIEKRINNISDAVDKIRPTVTQAQKALDNLDAKLENNKVSSITTLTIFSAVVLAFSGGITFESGMLQGMQAASAYRLAFVIALTGFVLFNTIFVLLYLVGKLAGKSISTRCKYIKTSENSNGRCRTCGDGYCTRPYSEASVGCKILHKYAYVAVINVLLLWMMYSDFILWFYQPPILDYSTIIRLLLPAALILAVWIFAFIWRFIQKKRNILSGKLNLVNQLVHPEKEEGSVFNTFATLLTKVIGGNTKSIVEEYKEIISCYDASTKKGFKQILQKTNRFVERRIVFQLIGVEYISSEKNRLNKAEWKMLLGALKEYLIAAKEPGQR